MTRAKLRFEVRVGRLRLVVRVVDGSECVARAWRARGCGRLQRGEHVHGFFDPQARGALGSMFLAESSAHFEVVPHECQHAALAALRRREGLAIDAPVTLDAAAEEYVATVAGLLSRRILRGLTVRGIACR